MTWLYVYFILGVVVYGYIILKAYSKGGDLTIAVVFILLMLLVVWPLVAIVFFLVLEGDRILLRGKRQ